MGDTMDPSYTGDDMQQCEGDGCDIMFTPNSHNQKYCFLPLLGFEEKTWLGAMLRRFFNSLNFVMAYFTGTIRIAIHPNDFNLYLKDDIVKYLSRSGETVLLHELS